MDSTFGNPVKIGDRILIYDDSHSKILGSGTIVYSKENDKHATLDKWTFAPRLREINCDDNYLKFLSYCKKKCDIISVKAENIRHMVDEERAKYKCSKYSFKKRRHFRDMLVGDIVRIYSGRIPCEYENRNGSFCGSYTQTYPSGKYIADNVSDMEFLRHGIIVDIENKYWPDVLTLNGKINIVSCSSIELEVHPETGRILSMPINTEDDYVSEEQAHKYLMYMLTNYDFGCI